MHPALSVIIFTTTSGAGFGLLVWYGLMSAFVPGERVVALVVLPLALVLVTAGLLSSTFHLGRPVGTLLEWENLDVWAGRPGHFHVVMPAPLAEEWPRRVKAGQLVEVLRSTDLGESGLERCLVLLRTEPVAPPAR